MKQCIYCTATFSTKQSLTRHQTSCKSLQQHLVHQHEIETLQQNHTSEYTKLLEENKRLREEVIQHESTISKLRKKIDELQVQLSSTETTKETMIKAIVCEKETLFDELQKEKEHTGYQRTIIDSLRKEIREQNEERKYMLSKFITFAEKAVSVKGTSIVPAPLNGPQLVTQLFHFDPMVFANHLDPATMIIQSVKQFATHLINLGLGNYYRISDRARKSIIWYDEQGTMIKDSNGSILCQRLIEALQTDLSRQQVYLEQQLQRCIDVDPQDRDMSRIQVIRADINFTSSLRQKQNRRIVELQKELASRAKDKNDTTIDTPKTTTYLKFTTRIEKVLLPKITDWIGLSPILFGTYLGRLLREYFTVEGASSNIENPYILIQDDSGYQRLVRTKEILGLIQKSLESILSLRSVIEDCLFSTKRPSEELTRQMLDWLQTSDNHTNQESKQFLRALVKTI